MLGLDGGYDRSWDEETFFDISLSKKGINLSREIGHTEAKPRSRIAIVASSPAAGQLKEGFLSLDLVRQLHPFTRCMDCNGKIQPVDKNEISAHVAPEILGRFETFRQCRDCRKIYWQGSHYDRMLERVRKLELTMVSDRNTRLDSE